MSVQCGDYSSASIVGALRAAGCVFAEDEARLLVSAARDDAELAALVARRVGGEPLEQVLGWAEFLGRRLAVRPGVFVPRRRTEFLATQAIALARPGSVVVDLCCGCGAVAAAVADAARRLDGAGIDTARRLDGAGIDTAAGVEVHAVDLDPVAVRCARENLGPLGGRVYHGDLYAPLPDALRGRVDVLAANAPYVPTGSIELMPPEARLHEPPLALDGGPDGLDVLRRVAAGAGEWLAPGGALLVETSQRQAPTLLDAVTRHGLRARVARSAELDATVVVGTAAA
jgi:release factor glutamine methyltransferase